MKWRQVVAGAGAVMAAGILSAATMVAAQSSSNNFKVEESFFGTGGELDASSSNYKAKQTAGELTVGNSASTSYQFQGGFNTTAEPLLEVAVQGGVYDLGVLDASTTHSTSAQFTVRNYLSSGYTVQLVGNPPKNSSSNHPLTTMATFANSSPGTEQFGVNLRDNTTPNVGTDPVQLPDASFGFGYAVNGYDTQDKFKFVDGSVIAASAKSSGLTQYTLSIIANISNDTPAGSYEGSFSVVVTPTF